MFGPRQGLGGELSFYLVRHVDPRHRPIAELYDQGRIRMQRETESASMHSRIFMTKNEL